MIGSYQGFFLMLANFLRIPPGTQVRKSYGVQKDATTDWYDKTLASHDFINTIVDITADDVCIGATPVYIENLKAATISPRLQLSYQLLLKAINHIVRWVAIDLLKKGISVYRLDSSKVQTYEFVKDKRVPVELNEAFLVPVNKDVTIFMRDNGRLDYFIDGQRRDDLLIFLSYSKEQLLDISNSSADLPDEVKKGLRGDGEDHYIYQVVPEPIQLKHVQAVAADLFLVERAMYRYRIQLSKIVRFATVESGLAQGNDNNETVVDNASAAVNANSMSLDMTIPGSTMTFDDSLPVVPIRKGVGDINVVSDIPDWSRLKDMPDLEYTLNRLFLALRFPKSYADFNQPISETAVSLIRGDIRYSRMVDSCRSLIQNTLNIWLFGDKAEAVDAPMTVKLTTLPNSEDDDVVEALDRYKQFVADAFEMISQAESALDATTILDSLIIIMGDTANLKAIQGWVQKMREYIQQKFGPAEAPEAESPAISAPASGRESEDTDTTFDEGDEDWGTSTAPDIETPLTPEELDLPGLQE